MKLKNKRLPNHWVYGLTPRNVKKFIRDLQADFRLVEFCGTRQPLQLTDETVLFMGELNGRVDAAIWCYRLRLWGAPSQVLEGKLQQVQDSLLETVRATVVSLRGDHVDNSVRPFDCSLVFRLLDGQIYADFETKDRGTLGKSIDHFNPWWLKDAT